MLASIRAEVSAFMWFELAIVFCFFHSMKYWYLDSLMVAIHVKINKSYTLILAMNYYF